MDINKNNGMCFYSLYPIPDFIVVRTEHKIMLAKVKARRKHVWRVPAIMREVFKLNQLSLPVLTRNKRDKQVELLEKLYIPKLHCN